MGRLLATASAVISVVAMALGLLLIGTRRAAANQARVTEVLTNAFVRSGLLTDLIAPNLVKGLAGGERAFASLTEDEMRNILRTLFPAEWQEAQARQLADQAYAYLFGSGNASGLTLSLEEPRRLIAGPAGERVAQIMVRSWPACSTAQINALDGASEIAPEMFGCEPPEPTASRVVNALTASLRQLAQAAPPAFNVGGEPGSGEALREVHAVLEALALWMVLALFVSAAGLMFALALAARSLKAVMRWTGITWMSGAALAMLVALALLAARNRLPTGFADAPAALREAMAALVRGVLGLAMGATFVVSVVALLVGSGVTAVSFVWRRPARLQVARQTERLPEGAPAATPPTRATRGPQTLPMPAAPQDSSAAPEEGERPKGLFG
jgi:hypothetical protein